MKKLLIFLAIVGLFTACNSAPAVSNPAVAATPIAVPPAVVAVSEALSVPPTPAPIPDDETQDCWLADTSIAFGESDDLEEVEILDTREFCLINLSKPAENAIIILTYTNESLLCKDGDVYEPSLEGWNHHSGTSDYLPSTCAGGLDVLRHGALGDELVYFIEARSIALKEHNWLIFDRTQYGLITSAPTVD